MKETKDLNSSNQKLRSAGWFAKNDKMGFVHRSWLRNQGYLMTILEAGP
jgi:dihydroxy-acid dehydratase